MEVQSLANRKSLKNYFRFPVACGPVEGLSLFDHLVKAAANFLQRGPVIVEVRIQQVDVVGLQPIQRFPYAFPNVLSVGRYRGIYVGLGGSVDFCGDDNFLPWSLQLFEGFSELKLCLARCVSFSSVEGVDSSLKGGCDDVSVLLVILWLVVDHVSEGNR